LLGSNAEDYNQEFEAYWSAEEDAVSSVAPNDQPRRISAMFNHGQLIAVGDDMLSLKALGHQGQERRAFYLPLDRGKMNCSHPRRLQDWDGILSEVSDESLAFLRSERVDANESRTVVLGVPRPEGGRALVGLILRKFKAGGVLAFTEPRRVIPFTLERFDPTRAEERLPQTAQRARRAVFGCGAVGGHVAHVLAWSGPGELILVDPKEYSPSKTFRHALGRTGWHAPAKVVGLKRQLEAHVPSLNVTAFQMTADQAISEHFDLIRALDVIVIAIGNPTIPLKLNDEFVEQRFPVPVVYAWLEPYGIGGHAVLVRYDRRGCLRCLFREDPVLESTIDFAAPGQKFGRHELGCHGMYVPYADLDARETALHAARLVERLSRSPDTAAWRVSWRGDSAAFTAANLKLSSNYDAYPSGFSGRVESREDCRACGDRTDTAVFRQDAGRVIEVGQ
jgi:molybdopterin/thiamine biosynthesis adenylyltransferase